MKIAELTFWTGHKQKRRKRIMINEEFRHATLLDAAKKLVQKEHPEIKQMKRCKLEIKL